LKPIHDQFSRANQYIDVEKVINLDEYAGCSFDVWASTPAILWTADRPQERGIHVHVRDPNGKWLVDDTFGVVIHQGMELNRLWLLNTMVANTII